MSWPASSASRAPGWRSAARTGGKGPILDHAGQGRERQRHQRLHPPLPQFSGLRQVAERTAVRPPKRPRGGHRLSFVQHLAQDRAKLVWDADKEEVLDDPEANAMLVRPYCAPWDKELRRWEWPELGCRLQATRLGVRGQGSGGDDPPPRPQGPSSHRPALRSGPNRRWPGREDRPVTAISSTSAAHRHAHLASPVSARAR